jgi:hypothetical protein
MESADVQPGLIMKSIWSKHGSKTLYYREACPVNVTEKTDTDYGHENQIF